MNALPQAFQRYREDINRELESILSRGGLTLYDMMRYHLGWIDEKGCSAEDKGGKLVRPTLCLLSCTAVGGDWRVALPAAAAVELVHNFSLIHDDIEDGGEKRRGRATVWRIWGEPQAINTGDAMHSLARLALLRLDGKGLSKGKVIRAASILDETCVELCEGQYWDISYEGRLDINIEAYLEMIDRKTAALMACSFEIGALLGTEDDRVVRGFQHLGRKLGLAYQMKDDILGIWGGKPSASDIEKRKNTLPVICAWERAKGEEREELLRIYRQETITSEDIDRVIQILSDLGAKEYAEAMAKKSYQEALAELEGAKLSPSAEEELRRVITFLVQREF